MKIKPFLPGFLFYVEFSEYGKNIALSYLIKNVLKNKSKKKISNVRKTMKTPEKILL